MTENQESDRGEQDKQRESDQAENTPETKSSESIAIRIDIDIDKGDKSQATEFEKEAQEAAPSLVGEFVDFLKYNKKWWLIPIILVMLLVGLLLLFSASSPVAPFIYPLF
jgi:hypothetical protein